ncbi:MAG: cupin domain-containing protein [Saprospiraceae bacterium]|nr:cupin domain-containing protein [Saprospiraceae bacterium]
MYPYLLPHRIENDGEVLIFEAIKEENGEQKMLVRNHIKPRKGPPFHVHFKQEEFLQVKSGKMGYQIHGEAAQVIGEGESILFKRNEMHRFWNAGDGPLECSGWVKPANSLDYFLTGIYNSMNKAGDPKGDPFDSAYLLTRYQSEYDLLDIPPFVKKVIMPITVIVGKLLGKYNHFQDAPEPLK